MADEFDVVIIKLAVGDDGLGKDALGLGDSQADGGGDDPLPPAGRQIDLDAGRLRVIRLKGSDDSVHPLGGREIRALRKLRRGQPVGSRFVFVTSRGGPMTRNGFFKILAKAGQAVGMPDIHPHLLRHGTGFKLVNDGMDTLSLAAYLGHRNVQNTARYAKMDARRFDGLWKD